MIHREEIESNVVSLGQMDMVIARAKLGMSWRGWYRRWALREL